MIASAGFTGFLKSLFWKTPPGGLVDQRLISPQRAHGFTKGALRSRCRPVASQSRPQMPTPRERSFSAAFTLAPWLCSTTGTSRRNSTPRNGVIWSVPISTPPRPPSWKWADTSTRVRRESAGAATVAARPQSKDRGVTCCRSHRPNAGSVGRHDECVAICKRTT